MRAVICRASGGPEGLVLDELPTPAPGPGQVTIDVHAAGVNFADILMVAGQYQEKPPLPFVPGLEVAGTVRAIGPGVKRLTPRQRVMAVLDHGGFAEQAVARESDVFAIPNEMDFATAAGFPITYGTAYGALRWRAGTRPGELLLVTGAAGGVGLSAVEVGKALGATVIAGASGVDKLALAAARGADYVIDYRVEDLRGRLKDIAQKLSKPGIEVAFDPVGGDTFDALFRALAWGGRVIVIGFAGGRVQQIPANLLLVKNASALGFWWGSYRKHAVELLAPAFAELFGWWSQGLLKPHVLHRLPLGEVAEALKSLKERRATGKVVLTLKE
ncbi:MAG TPA: NADPH:quinone oxidoreductase family protein [Alphaproteobacteria bacterium]|nr:NADPH:quinone oxidoreductase family protein [Alphaproteobacteria bacterium]